MDCDLEHLLVLWRLGCVVHEGVVEVASGAVPPGNVVGVEFWDGGDEGPGDDGAPDCSACFYQHCPASTTNSTYQ